MKSQARVVVIGGGVVGCSVAYHLTKLGCADVVLLERDELTSGSTWHAAGGMHTLNSDPNVAKLQDYTIKLYREIEDISGQSCGIHVTGGVMMAGTRERLDYLKGAAAKRAQMGLESHLVSPEEAVETFPVLDPSHFVGGLYDPLDGHIDPSGVTQAYAKAARIGGAEIERFCPVTALAPTADGGWRVATPKGTITAEHVINCGGLWAREVGRLVGLELPVLAMEHHYLLTEAIPEIADFAGEIGHCVDFEGELYLRQEGQGLLLGTYEQACVPWSVTETPADFGHELLAPDLDRLAPSLEVAFRHFPVLAEAGIKQVINGPFTFAPDGNPLVGPVRGLANFWVACGVMAGFSQGGGVGLTLANWLVEGDPGLDVFAMDVARFGDFATRAYTRAKVTENYRRRFSLTFPNEELPAGRPLRTTPIYGHLKDRGAVFGAAYGLEHALWFAPEGTEPREEPTFRRSEAHEPIGRECHAVRTGVGLIETSGFAKYRVTGPDAEPWLNRLLANHMPRTGRLSLTPMLNPNGRLYGDFTVARLADDDFRMFGSGPAEGFHMRWFEAHLPDRGVRVEALGTGLTGLAIAGPRSRELLGRLTDRDVSNEAFRFLDIRAMDLAMCPALVGRISFSGDLGYEIWVTPDFQAHLFEALVEAGRDLGLRLFGGRALNSLRLEKSFGGWLREYRPDYTPAESGLDRFVDFTKNDFIGRDAALRARDEGPAKKLITLTVETDEIDCVSDEPIYRDGRAVGFVTSGGFAHHSAKSVALGYVETAHAEPGPRFQVDILGQRHAAELIAEPLFDPTGARMRG